MSRLGLVLIVILLVLLGGIAFLATVDTEVQPTRTEKAMLNEAAPQ